MRTRLRQQQRHWDSLGFPKGFRVTVMPWTFPILFCRSKCKKNKRSSFLFSSWFVVVVLTALCNAKSSSHYKLWKLRILNQKPCAAVQSRVRHFILSRTLDPQLHSAETWKQKLEKVTSFCFIYSCRQKLGTWEGGRGRNRRYWVWILPKPCTDLTN